MADRELGQFDLRFGMPGQRSDTPRQGDREFEMLACIVEQAEAFFEQAECAGASAPEGHSDANRN